MQIRTATPADLDDLARLKTELVRAWFDDPTHLDDFPDYPARLRERLAELLTHPWYQYWVVEEDGRTVACMSASLTKHLPGPEWSGIHAHLADLFVEPGLRGRGIAKRLMTLAMDWCVAQGAAGADMHATQMAVPMYLAMGWIPNEDELGQRFTTMRYRFDA